MKKVLFVLLVFLVTLSSFAAEPAPITSWTRQDSVYPTTPGVLAPQMAGATIYGDYIYVLGGNQGQDGDTHRVFKIKVDQFTGALDPAVEVTSFESTLQNYCYLGNVCAAYNDHIYVGGGGYNVGGPNRNDVTFGKIIGDGDIDAAWVHSDIFPETPAVYDPELGALVIVNGYLYMMGGDGEFGGIFDRSYYAKIKTDGSLDTWQTGIPLPEAIYFVSACAIGNDIIMTPGLNAKTNTAAQDTIYVSQTNPADGSLGAWTLQTEKFPMPIYGTRLIAVGNTVFAFGGRTVGGAAQSSVWRALYDPATHTVGAWTAATDTQLPDAVKYHDAVYSPKSKSLYIVSIRDNGTTIYNEVWISSPLYDRPVPTPTPTPIPVLRANTWEIYD